MQLPLFPALTDGPLLTLIVGSLVVMGSPGPSTLSVVAVGAAYGLRRSLRYLAGVVAGTLAVLFMVATGVVALLMSVPQATGVLTVASAAYIFHLALRIARAPPLSADPGTDATPTFTGGFLLAIANPKAYVAIGALFAGTNLTRTGPGPVDAFLATGILAAMIVLIHVAWLLAGTSLARILRDARWSRAVNLAFAAALIASTVIAFLR